MKLVRAVAVLVGLADIAFAVWFVAGARSLAEAGTLVYPIWLGVSSLGSAALLFLAASDPERYFPVLFVVTGGRALATVVAIPFFLKGVVLAIGISEGALTAVLVLVILHAVRERRAAAAAALEGQGPGQGPAKPAKPKA